MTAMNDAGGPAPIIATALFADYQSGYAVAVFSVGVLPIAPIAPLGAARASLVSSHFCTWLDAGERHAATHESDLGLQRKIFRTHVVAAKQ